KALANGRQSLSLAHLPGQPERECQVAIAQGRELMRSPQKSQGLAMLPCVRELLGPARRTLRFHAPGGESTDSALLREQRPATPFCHRLTVVIDAAVREAGEPFNEAGLNRRALPVTHERGLIKEPAQRIVSFERYFA